MTHIELIQDWFVDAIDDSRSKNTFEKVNVCTKDFDEYARHRMIAWFGECKRGDDGN